MALSIRSLNMKQYQNALATLMDTRLKAVDAGDLDYNIPTFIWGPPGIGKSQILSSICKQSWLNAKDAKGKDLYSIKWLSKMRPWDAANWSYFSDEEKHDLEKNPNGYILMDVRLSQVDPVEIKGAPFYDVKNMKAGFIRFNSILPDPNCKFPVFLLLDEFPLAPDMVQSAGYQLINDRKVGDYRLPHRCVVIAAGNRPEDGGVHFEMSLALENRFDHIGLDTDYEGFVKYVSRGEHGYDETMVAFLQYNMTAEKSILYKLDAGKGNFPTFRSWEKALRKVKYGIKEYDAIADSVGQAGATKFEQFKEITKDIPHPDELVKKKMYYTQVQLQLVASQKVGNMLLNKDTISKFTPEKAFEYFRYFVDMCDPKDKTNNREELTILFLVNVRDDMDVLDKIDTGFKKALKAGTIKMEKNEAGDDIKDIYGMIFSKWRSLSDID